MLPSRLSNAATPLIAVEGFPALVVGIRAGLAHFGGANRGEGKPFAGSGTHSYLDQVNRVVRLIRSQQPRHRATMGVSESSEDQCHLGRKVDFQGSRHQPLLPRTNVR